MVKRTALLLLFLAVAAVASAAENIMFDGVRNGNLLFHVGNLYITAKCNGGAYYEEDSKPSKYSNCVLPGNPGNTTQQSSGKPCKATDVEGVFYGLGTTDLSFQRVKGCKILQLEMMDIVDAERR